MGLLLASSTALHKLLLPPRLQCPDTLMHGPMYVGARGKKRQVPIKGARIDDPSVEVVCRWYKLAREKKKGEPRRSGGKLAFHLPLQCKEGYNLGQVKQTIIAPVVMQYDSVEDCHVLNHSDEEFTNNYMEHKRKALAEGKDDAAAHRVAMDATGGKSARNKRAKTRGKESGSAVAGPSGPSHAVQGPSNHAASPVAGQRRVRWREQEPPGMAGGGTGGSGPASDEEPVGTRRRTGKGKSRAYVGDEG